MNLIYQVQPYSQEMKSCYAETFYWPYRALH